MRVRKIIRKKISLVLYKSLLSPAINCGDIIFDVANRTCLNRVQKIHNSVGLLLWPINEHISLTSVEELKLIFLKER